MSVTTFTTVNGRILRQNKDGVVHNFVSDPLGSVVMVRDTSGNTVYEAEYDPYGNVQSESGTNPYSLGYVGTLGYIKDSASSMYVRARYLLNNLGRWLTKDPLWPSEAGYVYAGALPSQLIDPSGLRQCPAIVEEIRQGLHLQLHRLRKDKNAIAKVNSCIQAAASAGRISCDPFRLSTASCLDERFPVVHCYSPGEGDCGEGAFG